MTEQILDMLIYQGYEYFVYAISGEGLLTPKDLGISSMGFSTACERGYYMKYLYDKEKLHLKEMTVRTEDEIYPTIEGFYCYRGVDMLWTAVTYTGSRMYTTFTGGLIIGRDIRRGTGKPISFSAWYDCKMIVELKFENGKIHDEIDHSPEMDNYVNSPYSSEMQSIFSLKYDFNYPWSLVRNKK